MPRSPRAPRRLLGGTLAGLLAVVSLATVAPPAAAVSPDLLFTEYVEGTSFNKALEIANLTGAPVDLAAYRIELAFNGDPAPGSTITLSGTLADGEVFVVANTQAGPAVTAQADLLTGSLTFNGDDTVVLRRDGDGGPVVDSIGQVGVDPGSEWGTGLTSTADNTIRRKATVTEGDTDPGDAFDPAVEWDGFATDSFGGLGLAYGTTDPPPDPSGHPPCPRRHEMRIPRGGPPPAPYPWRGDSRGNLSAAPRLLRRTRRRAPCPARTARERRQFRHRCQHVHVGQLPRVERRGLPPADEQRRTVIGQAL